MVFAPPLWYDLLVVATLAAGALLVVDAFVRREAPVLRVTSITALTGVAVVFAGAWGALSNERMACDVRAGTYARLEGQGFAKQVTRGSLSELDALVLLTEVTPALSGLGRSVLYRLVLYWKGSKEPLLIVECESRNIPAGAAINVGAGNLLAKGARIAKLLGIRFYDNSYFASPCPLRPV